VAWAAVALAPAARPADPPNQERVETGAYVKKGVAPGVLVHREAAGKTFQTLVPGSKVSTADELMALPGARCELRLDSGVHLVLRGMLPEFSQDQLTHFLMESAVTLHKDPEFDLDLTLHRGRVYLSNHKEMGPARVRLRFGPPNAPEVWDLTLNEPGSEAGIDFSRHYTRDINWAAGEEPRMELVVQVLSGKAGLKIGAVHHPRLTAPPGPGLFTWNNRTGRAVGPQVVENRMPIWQEEAPRDAAAKEMLAALKDLAGHMGGDKSPVAVVEESLGSDRLAVRELGYYCLGAMDAVNRLLSVLGEEDPNLAPDRDKAIFALRRWIGRNTEQSKLLYDPEKKTGLLTKKYRPKEAEIVVTLLHDFPDDALRSPETYELLSRYLVSDKVAIADLAYWQLLRLSRGVKLPDFNAAWPKDMRQPVADAVDKLVKAGKLPPP
jgi:hypothetical protein